MDILSRKNYGDQKIVVQRSWKKTLRNEKFQNRRAKKKWATL